MNWIVPQNLKENFISGYTYYKICKWSVCPRYPQNFNINNLEENDRVFLNLDYAEHFYNYIINNKPIVKFQLLTQNSDRDFDDSIFSKFKYFCNKIYSINTLIQDSNVIKIPIGFNDQSTITLDTIDIKSLFFFEKSNLVYLNFKNAHHPSRPLCTNYFKDFTWVTYNPDSNFLPIFDFYNQLKSFKYCICPRGTGLDTHRIYECLLFGVLPIVQKSELDDLYIKLPIILVDEWSEITEQFLNDKYDFYREKYLNWIHKNSNWYLPEYWVK